VLWRSVGLGNATLLVASIPMGPLAFSAAVHHEATASTGQKLGVHSTASGTRWGCIDFLSGGVLSFMCICSTRHEESDLI